LQTENQAAADSISSHGKLVICIARTQQEQLLLALLPAAELWLLLVLLLRAASAARAQPPCPLMSGPGLSREH
jgi:hypothetical protein